MTDEEIFSALILARDFGLLEPEDVVDEVDKRISELDSPPEWMLELSTVDKSTSLPLHKSSDVLKCVLRKAYEKWKTNALRDFEFRKCLRAIWGLEGHDHDWYFTLVSVEDDVCLIEDGIVSREDHVGAICEELERILAR